MGGFFSPGYLLVRNDETDGEVRFATFSWYLWMKCYSGSMHTQPMLNCSRRGHVVRALSASSWALGCLWCFQIQILPSVSNQKWLIEDPKKLVTLKYTWISALCADWIAVLSRRTVVQAGLSHVVLKYVFIVEWFCVSSWLRVLLCYCIWADSLAVIKLSSRIN